MKHNSYIYLHFKRALEDIKKAKDGSFVDRLNWYFPYTEERHNFANSGHLEKNINTELDEAIRTSNKRLNLPKRMDLGDRYNLIEASFALFVEKEIRDYRENNNSDPNEDEDIRKALNVIDLAISVQYGFDYLSLKSRAKITEPKAQESLSGKRKPQRTHIDESALKRIAQRALSIARLNKG